MQNNAKKSNLKERIKHATAGDFIYFVCFVVSVIILVIAFLTPPPFQIHDSVLKAVGLMGIFSTISKVGDWIKLGLDVKFKKGEFEIELNNNNDEKNS